MPTRHGMAQVWLAFMLSAMIVSDGVERRNMALVGVLNAIALVGATRRQRRR